MSETIANRAAEAYAYPLLMKQLWHAPLYSNPEQEIVYRELFRCSYRESRQRIGRLASVLTAAGVRFGDTVAVMDWDSHRYFEAFSAVPMMGAVLQTVNIRLTPEQVLYTFNHAGPTTLLLHEDFLPIWSEIAAQASTIERVIWISDTGAPVPATLECALGEYEALLASGNADHEFPEFDENTRATTFYTTGTTGNPKGVYFSHRQLVLHTLGGLGLVAGGASGQRFHRGDVYMPLTPMFHVHAWGMPQIALTLGVKQVYPGRYIPERILQLIDSEGVTFSHCVPTVLQMVLGAPKSAETDLSRWKVIIGGSALSRGMARSALARGIDVFSGYGMSETCPLLTIAQLQPQLGELDEAGEIHFRTTSGYSVPLVHLRTINADGSDVPDNDGSETGEIVARAPWLTQGYLRDQKASDELWAGGWLHTQDVGYFEKGYLRVTDRVKDLIKAGGEWISSVQIEDMLSQHPAVAEAAAFAIASKKWGEMPAVLVILRPGTEATEGQLRDHLRQFVDQGLISRFAVLAKIQIVDSIAKTSVGKLNKRVLREQFAHLGER